MNGEQKVVAYTDLLGFSPLVVRNLGAAQRLLSDFYNMAQRINVNDGFAALDLFLFSDFLFVQSDDVTLVVNYVCKLCREALRYSETSAEPMLCRGGVARGSVITQRRNEAPNVTKNFIVSPALTHAVKMEGLVKGQRMLLAANEREELSHFWNPQINSICYDQPSIRPTELFLKYKYKDLLWARDLSKEHRNAKDETRHLVEIASNLFQKNYGNRKSVSVHYAETLRICMRSYADLLEQCSEDRGLLSHLEEVLTTCPDESTWLGFLEMVLLSRDAFAFQRDEAVLTFLRMALLDLRWGAVCSALQRQENSQLLNAVKELIDVATRT